ncbi:MAG: potassium transporter TrkG [Candidatus Hermodarchaeota archaeon]
MPSIFYAFFRNEINAATALLITAVVFLCLGFILNALCERKTVNFKQSCALLVLFYLVITIINSIPYLYLGIFDGNLLDQFFNSWFETVSASSTSGLTLLDGVIVPKSLVLARGISEWVGGIGLIFILLSSFYPSESLFHYAKVLGIEKIAKSYRGSFLVVLVIYVVYTIIFSGILILSGVDVFTAFHTTFTIFSTTGLTIVNVLNLPILAIVAVTVMMLFSAFSFTFHLNLISSLTKMDWKNFIKGNWRMFISSLSKVNLKKLLPMELKIYLLFLLLFTIAFWYETGVPLLRSFFHITDFSSSCGLNLINFNEITEMGKIILIIAMFVGPMSFSVGGGIRVLRVYVLFKAIRDLPKTFLRGETSKIKLEEDYIEMPDFVLHLLIIVLFIVFSFFAAVFLCNYGYSFVDALVESVSAITTTGDSPKILTPTHPFSLKFLLTLLMFLGRIEIIPVFIAFSRVKETKKKEYYRKI